VNGAIRVISGSCRKRIARGSGTTVQDVALFGSLLGKRMMKALKTGRGRHLAARLFSA
jgi:signal recognition particle GTPase